MEKIQLKVIINESKMDKTFLVFDESGTWEEAVGIARGVHHAINNFVENFNAAKFVGDDGRPIMISCEDVLKPKRPYEMRHIIDLA